MTKPRAHLTIMMALAVAGSSSLVGCGSSSSDATDQLAALKSGESTLRVGTDATFPPFEFTNSSGKKVGFDIELIRAIAKQIGIKKVDFQQTAFGSLVPGLQADKIDVAASAVYITDERAKVVDFTQSYFPGGLTMLVPDSNTSITAAKDLAGKTVAVQVGTKSVEYLNKNYPTAKVKSFQTNDQMFQATSNGQSDVTVTGYPAARYYIKQHGGLKTVGNLLTEEHYGYALQKDHKDLLTAFNKALDTLDKNGNLKTLEKKWFGEAPKSK